MSKSESIKNITTAIIAVMKEVKGIEKSMTVGTGNSSYKGVPDQEVKKIIGDSMAKNGLSIVPIGVETKTQVDRWEEETQYGKKQKQSVFTEATTTYLLLHTSGEFIEVAGYGHGVDSQDKGAGKATTYALKYTLLYLFLVPTGKIDDADTIHSESSEVPARTNGTNLYNRKELGTKDKPLISNSQFKSLVERVTKGDNEALVKALNTFSFDEKQQSILDQFKQPA